MGRWLAIDYGVRRIGLAWSDPRAMIASPAPTLTATGTVAGDAKLVLDHATRHGASGLVVGLPLGRDGSDTQQTRLVRTFADELRRGGQLPVELWDERLTSAQADRLLADSRVRRARRRTLRDAIAAQVILQSFLDARRGRNDARAGDGAWDNRPPER